MCGVAHKWLSNYLQDRFQVVKIGDYTSEKNPITCGIPQGSILGPTLFIIYTNEVPDLFNTLNPILYADDTNLFYESKTCNMSDIQAINSELQNFYNWTLINKLSLNLSKTCAMIIKSPNNRTDLTLYQQLTLGGGPLSFVSSTKFLGVTIDDRLS